jgi:hypothetical protein
MTRKSTATDEVFVGGHVAYDSSAVSQNIAG